MNKLLLTNATLSGKSTKKTLAGQEHIVFSATALVEGVHNDMLYSNEEIGRDPSAWNGVPVTVNHPTSNGEFVSANSPEFENTIVIGKVFNANFANSKLTCEVWVNVETAKNLGFDDILAHFEANKVMEVSTGLFSDPIQTSGTYGDESYGKAVRKIVPNHLAMLPTTEGACSIADGCGAMVVNEKSGEKTCCDKCSELKVLAKREDAQAESEARRAAYKLLGLKSELTVNELSHNDIWAQLNALLEQDKPEGDSYPYVQDIFDEYFIYYADGFLYSRGYETKNDVITLLDDAFKVNRVMSYEPEGSLLGNSATTIDVLKVNNMNEKEKESRADALIANEANSYDDKDKEGLLALSDELFEKVAPAEKEVTEVSEVSESTSDPLSANERATLNRFLAKEDAKIDVLRKAIIEANPDMDAKIIANLDAAAVEAFAGQIKGKTDFSANGGAGSAASSTTVLKSTPIIVNANTNTKEGA